MGTPLPGTEAGRMRMGHALVALQFALLLVLAGAGLPPLLDGTALWPAWAALALGTGLGAWALAANRPGNFRIHPAPHAAGRLVQAGPYRWIRHPMYSALLVAGAGCVVAAGGAGRHLGWAAGVAWFGLAAVLVAKATLEEQWLVRRYPGYAAYRGRTRRFVPGLY